MVVVAAVVASVSGGGSGCDVEVGLGFDLAADANSAGNGVLLAAMPQAYSISVSLLCSLPASLSLSSLKRQASNLKPCHGLSFFPLRGSVSADGRWVVAPLAADPSLSSSRWRSQPHTLRISIQISQSFPTVKVFALETSLPVPARLGSLIGPGNARPLAPTRPVGRGAVALESLWWGAAADEDNPTCGLFSWVVV